MIDAILAGRKTRTTRPQTRIVIPQPPEYRGTSRDYWDCDCMYKVGHEYAVSPGRGKKAVTRIRVTAVTFYQHGVTQIPEDAREDHARREGFASWLAFRQVWYELYRRDILRQDGPVYVIDFELVKE
ncbi:MAG: hypothetical protein NUW01_12760 [Gemmatimonadaceae bacterium]|nr:hypothetical protein [Gemmatimonadaceae bacterium]